MQHTARQQLMQNGGRGEQCLQLTMDVAREALAPFSKLTARSVVGCLPPLQHRTTPLLQSMRSALLLSTQT